ncbi:serine/threonine-protein kinase [Crossiella sp. CA198]|uniref:serine/threonine-protein kinase n=1 Tax=Crossiella sp. CA198 TaxID=3455607 RepID=UPI003F8D1288
MVSVGSGLSVTCLNLDATWRGKGRNGVGSNGPLGDHPRHERRGYQLEARPVGRGGQGQVFPAMHKGTGIKVAFKRRSSWGVEAVARMRREIEFGQLPLDNDHIMPVLDHGLSHDWFVMPFAEGGSAEDARASFSHDDRLKALVLAVCSALEVTHAAGWLHRDLKPANILSVEGRWTVADWGFGRRRLGDTTFTGRTAPGEFFGTYGFAAPEQATDAHNATPSADLYSLGQIIGWARTGKLPKDGTPLLPAAEPWRSVVVAATVRDPSARPQNAHEFRELVGAI